jgi:5-methyltetrahydropteroyltriglutamate--homocysteine methyltransferase
MMNPPFRADHVGSFLRPPRLVEKRKALAEKRCTAEALREVEDDCIREVVRKQEEVGLQGITDGEFRRTFFHVDFLERLEGVTVTYGDFTSKFQRDDGIEVGMRPPTMRVTDRIRHVGPIQGADYDFLAGAVGRMAKVCIPAPSMLHFRGGRSVISETAYPDLEAFYEDLGAAYRAEIGDLAKRGCRYLQMDDTNLAYLCDPQIRQATADRGDDPDALTHLYCRMVNDAIRDRPDDMSVSVHLCRGNFRSAWVAQGGYEPVAEIMFNEMSIDGFFLEYDDERSGDFSPLRHMPKDRMVILGLLSSKLAAVEPADLIRKRIDEAARYVPLDQCGLSPQCGFSSTAHGNDIGEDDQWRKLERCVEVARDVWG